MTRGPDDMDCADCGADVFPLHVESYSVIYWNPGTEEGELVTTFCPRCWGRRVSVFETRFDGL